MKLPIPAWAGSVIFHLIGLLLLLLFIRPTSEIRGAPGGERTDRVGIVLNSESHDGTVYRNETETFQKSDSAASSGPLTANPTDFDPGQFLPQMPDNVIGPSLTQTDGDSGQTGRLENKIGSGSGRGSGSGGSGTGSAATVSVFGLEGTGHKFAFVFDRSASMSEQGNKPIRAAKAELIRALESLQSVHQLLVVFYNEEPRMYPSGERSGRLIFATDDNKEEAKRFVGSIVPDGATNHEKALVVATKSNPDVIFLLTDGQPKDDLSQRQLDKILKVSGGIQINVIQFGFGPEPRNRNYLKLLAAQNAGLYQYIDIGTF